MTDMSNAEFIRDLAGRMFRSATPAMGFDQGDTDRLYAIANRLEPAAGIGHDEEADYAELKRLYNFSDDDSAQFTRWNMLTAIRHGKRLGQEFDAGEPVAWRYDPPNDGMCHPPSLYSDTQKIPPRDWTETSLYARPQSRGQAFDGEGEAVNPDTARLDALRDECWDLRCFSVPTGGDDADVAWKVVGHWMAEPQERTIAEGWSHDPRVAIDAALSSAKRGEG